MSALAARRLGSRRAITRDRRPLAASVTTFQGALAMAITSGTGKGFYAPADGTKVGVVVGRFTESVVNSGAAGAASAEIDFFREREVFLLVNDTGTALVAADRESPCYALDDQTATGAANSNAAGVVYDVTSEGVWVEFPKPGARQAEGIPLIQSGATALVSGTKTVTGVAITASSVIVLTRKTQGGTVTNTVVYDAPSGSRTVGGIATGQFIINACVAAGTTNAADTSTIDYVIVG